MKRTPLTKAAENSLDDGLLAYLKRAGEPRHTYQLHAHAELHYRDEIDASLARLKARGRVYQTKGGWSVLTSEDECCACEFARLTYTHAPRMRHTCAAPLTGSMEP